MDIKNIAISAKVVIESLVCLLENENVDLSSIKFKVGSASEGYESPNMEFGKLIDIALDGLEELKENPTKAPEGFVLVPKEQFESLSKFKDLYKRAIINAKKRKNQLNWAHVASLGIGSGLAVELCKAFNIDPGATNMQMMIEAQEQIK